MRLCDEIKMWNKIIPSFSLPRIGKKPRSPYKEIPYNQKDHIKVTVDKSGARTISLEKKKAKDKPPRKISFGNRKRDETAKSSRPKCKDKKISIQTHSMGTQANRHDLEFLITDPTLTGQQVQTDSDEISDKFLYKRETGLRRKYLSRTKILDLNGQTTDNISVQLTDLNRKENQTDDKEKVRGENEADEESDSDTDVRSNKSSHEPEPQLSPAPPRHRMVNQTLNFIKIELVYVILMIIIQ